LAWWHVLVVQKASKTSIAQSLFKGRGILNTVTPPIRNEKVETVNAAVYGIYEASLNGGTFGAKHIAVVTT